MASKVLAGRYELFEKIGEGGMSVVYKAKDRLLNRFVAIKVLKPEFIKDRKFIDLVVDIARNAFEGDQPFVEGTPEGDTVLKVFKRLKPVFRILNKKLHGSQGEEIDMYELLKHSLGNYGVSDYDATIKLR